MRSTAAAISPRLLCLKSRVTNYSNIIAMDGCQGMTCKPLVSFGVLTDVQYADRNKAQSWCDKDKWRYYRSSLNLIRSAFRTWQQDSHGVSFVMQLGDLLDGSNATMNLDSEAAMKRTLAVFDEFPETPTYHVLGNHELYNFNRWDIRQHFGPTMTAQLPLQNTSIPENDEGNGSMPPLAYYSFSPAPQVSVVVLDCFDVSIAGYSKSNPKYAEAVDILRQFHEGENPIDWEHDDHLHGINKRFMAYNGAVGPEQLQWLEHELQLAERLEQKVIVCGHIPLLPESSHPSAILWNFEEVLRVLHRYSCVVAYLGGHLHDSGYGQDTHGIHHLTFAGIIETAPEDNAFSTLHVYANRIEVAGYGREVSYTLPFQALSSEPEHPLNVTSVEVQVEA